jgi:hypothetical protein
MTNHPSRPGLRGAPKTPVADVLSQAKKVLGVEDTDKSFLEERPKQIKTKTAARDVWAKAAEMLAPKEIPEPEKPNPTRYSIGDIDAEPGDNDPIVVSPRSRKNGRVVFQRYQFRLFPNSDRSSRANRGLSPHIWEGLKQHASTKAINEVAQAMPKAFSVGVPSPKFDFTNVPREPTPETAWVFNDARLRDFIVRKISDTTVSDYEKDPGGLGLVRLFGSALKAYVNLYTFFYVGMSDKSSMDDPDLAGPIGFWASATARRKHRSRLLAEGLELYGIPPEGKPLQDQKRTKRVWPIFMRVFRRAVE